ncbi:VOC family protein [Nocardia neocaledoniensis]|uniref:VOC family protein n=1 Tax=Nocardia neocaledoniensis TaxID=236511 RepID=UPI002456F48D|nr:VOC family protein [Nocardia neocaledoniensis]
MPVLYGHSAVTVTDLRASLSYYRDALGLDIADENRTADRLSVDLRLPGTDRVWRLEEYRRQTRYPASSRPCDPGFAHLCLYVGDAEAVFARLQARGFTSRAPVATVAAGPLAGAKAVYTMDPDGFVVELYQRPGETGPPAVTGFFHHGVTVSDLDATLAFWQNEMGVELLRRSSAPGSMAGAIAGLEFDRVEAAFVGLGDAVAIEIFEYQGIERHSALAREVDPGSSRLALRVAEPDVLCERLGGFREASGFARVTDPTGYPILLLPL